MPDLEDRIITDPLYMSAAIGPDGNVVTEQAPGEIYTDEDRAQVSNIPSYGENIHNNIITGQYIDAVYQDFLNSREGQEYVAHLRRHGNGKRMPGILEKIIVTNEGKGKVAATLPNHVKSNLIVNADYIDQAAQEFSRKTGLSYEDAIKGFIIHELNHYFFQSSKDLRQSIPKVEFDNDFSLVKFYMSLANKIPEQKELYIKKARLFTERYGGDIKKVMDSYIEKNRPDSKLSLEEKLRQYIFTIRIKLRPKEEQYSPLAYA
jgi:predicted metallopeptidase